MLAYLGVALGLVAFDGTATEGTGAADSGAHPFAHVQPNPDLTPAEVIRYQVDALARNDVPDPNTGIEITFRFASPENRRVTGPLERFTALLHNPLYRDMLNHRRAEYGAPLMRGDMALGPVIITTAEGNRVGYMFQLSRQLDESCVGCWMTEGVTRLDPNAAEAGQTL
jgi:hypothetical protein